MNHRHTLKKKIKSKFGSYSNFARLANIDRYDLQRNFLTADQPSQEWVVMLGNLASTLTSVPRYGILPSDRLELLREAINAKGGVIQFCNDAGFSKNTVFHIVGKYGPESKDGKKLLTPVTERLLKHFSI